MRDRGQVRTQNFERARSAAPSAPARSSGGGGGGSRPSGGSSSGGRSFGGNRH
jgi:hypothetical protein